MRVDPHIPTRLRVEISDRHRWQTRIVVLAFGALSGLSVVGFVWLADRAFEIFQLAFRTSFWLPLLVTPAATALVVWATRRWAIGAEGSGIPQVIAALESGVGQPWRSWLVSLRLAGLKMALTACALVGGLSLGREGPSVQVAAGVMHAARRWLPSRTTVSDHGLLVAGGAAGIAAAFNTPLGGIMFAIEELSRRPEQRSSGLIMSAIVLAGLMGVSVYGDSTYFGVIFVRPIDWSLLLPGVAVALSCGLAGGLFARLLTASLSGSSGGRLARWRSAFPVRFAAGCGLAVAVIGLASQGATFGSGYEQTRNLLEGNFEPTPVYVVLKFAATWITAWTGVPGGIFAPSLAIGGGVGAWVGQVLSSPHHAALIALGMAAFLAAVTQAPMTAFIIVMEMIHGYNLVLSLMACSMVASSVSRMLCRPLYSSLAELQLRRFPPEAGVRPSASAEP